MVNRHLMVRFLSVVVLATASCNSPTRMTDEQLHEKALSLPLEARYDLYVEVYMATTPRNPLLAEDIVQLAQPARRYTLQRASRGSGAELGAALTVISQFSEGCSDPERTTLLKAVEGVAESEDQREALVSRVMVTCQQSTPKGWR